MNIEETVWTDRDGTLHPLCLMKEDHIYNILRCLEKKGKTTLNLSNYQKAIWKLVFEQELQNRTYQIF